MRKLLLMSTLMLYLCSPIYPSDKPDVIRPTKGTGRTFNRSYIDGLRDISKLSADKLEDAWIFDGVEWKDVCYGKASKGKIDDDTLESVLIRGGKNKKYILVHNHTSGDSYDPPSRADMFSAMFFQSNFSEYNLKFQVTDKHGVWTFFWNKLPNISKSESEILRKNDNSIDYEIEHYAELDSIEKKVRPIYNRLTNVVNEYLSSYILLGKIFRNDGFENAYLNLKHNIEKEGISLQFTPYENLK